MWMLWSKTEARRFVKDFVVWLEPLRKDFRDSVRFLLSPKFDAARRKTLARSGRNLQKVSALSLSGGNADESVFVPGVRPVDVEELYYAFAKTMIAEWFNRCPDRAYVDCRHTVGFTAGKEVSIIRIQIDNLTAIHGMPDDGRDRKGHPFATIEALEFANRDWPALFRERCAKK